jgi:uncharacterized protein YjiS (DUF1127 family)
MMPIYEARCPEGILRRACLTITDYLGAVRNRLVARQARAQLMQMPDGILKDIGISRCEIIDFVAGNSTLHRTSKVGWTRLRSSERDSGRDDTEHVLP